MVPQSTRQSSRSWLSKERSEPPPALPGRFVVLLALLAMISSGCRVFLIGFAQRIEAPAAASTRAVDRETDASPLAFGVGCPYFAGSGRVVSPPQPQRVRLDTELRRVVRIPRAGFVTAVDAFLWRDASDADGRDLSSRAYVELIQGDEAAAPVRTAFLPLAALPLVSDPRSTQASRFVIDPPLALEADEMLEVVLRADRGAAWIQVGSDATDPGMSPDDDADPGRALQCRICLAPSLEHR